MSARPILYLLIYMKNMMFRLSIALVTFGIGSTAVFLVYISTISLDGIKIKDIPAYKAMNASPVLPITEDSPTAKSEDAHRKPRFSGTYRGCGFGYIQGYETDDHQELAEGVSGFETREEAAAEFQKRITKAIWIVERTPNYKNRLGELGERLVIINPPDHRNAEITVSILWYDGEIRIDHIEAPTLELAFEFENFLKATNYRAF